MNGAADMGIYRAGCAPNSGGKGIHTAQVQVGEGWCNPPRKRRSLCARFLGF